MPLRARTSTSHSIVPARRRPLTRAGAVAALVLLLGAIAGPALAHDRLLTSTPADGETLTTAPTQLVLSYSDEIAPIGVEVTVTGPAGEARSGDPQVSGTDLIVPLAADLPSGSYAVAWRVTSSDGHPIDGTSAFTLDVPAPSPTPEPSASPTIEPTTAAPTTEAPSPTASAESSTSSESTASPAPSGVSGLPGWAIGVIAVGIVGSIVAVLMRLRRGSRLGE
ncbi:copper resistance CopC family protein [Miniimonas sp. S16]|uniref:copper resistance CopC family protein n=1 Tax=Miniimonas sp. S16 TaxID=2171623 RepID=UPI00131EE178|nr:copper resistance CopC family protein [Miniimonas sp. S16]